MKKIRHMIERYFVTKIEPIEEDVAEENPPQDGERSCHQNRTLLKKMQLKKIHHMIESDLVTKIEEDVDEENPPHD